MCIGAHDVEFPIRKTASEPNLKVKSTIKQKLSQDRRDSPLMVRRRQLDKLNNTLPGLLSFVCVHLGMLICAYVMRSSFLLQKSVPMVMKN